jgi:fructan beta-fructosidase
MANLGAMPPIQKRRPSTVAACAAAAALTAHPCAAEPTMHEALRPQFHFTPRENWHNDPNGLLWFGGEYHMFFQHNPKGREWGNMTWGHAVSPDLVHWIQLPHAIYPDRLGTVFSGSAVVDYHNTAGFQTGRDPALVAIYTAAGGTSDESKGQPFTQCIAFSNDKGRTWTKYAGNPVVPNIGDGDRDPKVFWHAPTHRWVMPLYVGEIGAGKPGPDGKPTTRNACHFYASPDLKTWSYTGKFSEELFECPGLVSLPVDDGRSGSKWVLWGGSGEYWAGRFDGKVFTAETPKLKGDFGSNFYAAQAYDDLPDHRVVLVTWMSGGKYPGMPFNQQMGFPGVLDLRTTPEGLRMARWPVKEIDRIAESPVAAEASSYAAGDHALGATDAELLDLEFIAAPGSAKTVSLVLRGNRITWDAASGSLTAFGKTAPWPAAPATSGHSGAVRPNRAVRHAGDVFRVRALLDRTSIELYGNGGEVCASYCFVPTEGPAQNRIVVEGGDTGPVQVVERRLRSIW